MSNYDPRDYCDSESELAAEVLDREEYSDWRQQRAQRLRSRAALLARARKAATQAANPDPWGGAA